MNKWGLKKGMVVCIFLLFVIGMCGCLESNNEGNKTPANQSPTCSLSANPTSGNVPLTTTFYMGASDTDGNIASWSLDVNNDGNAEYSGSGLPPSTKQYTFQYSGVYSVVLIVRDDKGKTSSDSLQIIVYVKQVTLDVNININQGKPIFTVETNLPQNMEFMFTVSNDTRILGQAKANVVDGTVSAGPFSLQGNPYPSGIYNLDISSPLVQLQPPDVQEILGQNGKNVSGEYISEGMVSYDTYFTVE